jgi:hypothetical protein
MGQKSVDGNSFERRPEGRRKVTKHRVRLLEFVEKLLVAVYIVS